MATVVLTASNFNFGPIGAALHVAEALEDRGHDVRIFGDRRVCELAAASGHLPLQLPRYPSGDHGFFDRVFSGADVLVSSMEPDSIQAAVEHGVPAVWLDSLTWWTELPYPESIDQCKLRIRVRSLEPPEQRKKATRDRWVGPLVPSEIAWRGDRDYALVSIGGVSPEVDSIASYLDIFADALNRVTGMLPPLKIVGSSDACSHLNSQLRGAAVEFSGTVSPATLRTWLSEARMLMGVPGLGLPMEAWAIGAPLMILAPLNLSQVLQLERYVRLGAAELPMAAVTERWAIADWYSTTLPTRLETYLRKPEERERMASMGRRFMRRLGGTGIGKAADAIEQVILRGAPRSNDG